MLDNLRQQLLRAGLLLLVCTLLTGIAYPLFVTALAQSIFPWQANGSVLLEGNKPIGSRLIGQSFTDKSYFWGRPSATSPYPYNGAASSGSNAGPSNLLFLALVRQRIQQMQEANVRGNQAVPIDLVTASGSGLDPEISPEAAFYQSKRVAQARRLPESVVVDLIRKNTRKRSLGLLGEARVNVLELNLALDRLRNEHG